MAIVRTTFSPKCCCRSSDMFDLHPCRSPYRDLKHQFLAVVLAFESIENRRQLLGVEFDYIPYISDCCSLCGESRSLSRAATAPPEICHTVNNGTNDLVNLSFSASICRGPSLCDRWDGLFSQRLEGASGDRGSSEGRPAQATGDAATSSRSAEFPKGWFEARRRSNDACTHLLSMFADEGEVG
jgi:hypothetical protein